jgi:hypothetical protein
VGHRRGKKPPKDYLRCVRQLRQRTDHILSTAEQFLWEHNYCKDAWASYYFFSGGSRGAEIGFELRVGTGKDYVRALAFNGEGDSVEFLEPVAFGVNGPTRNRTKISVSDFGAISNKLIDWGLCTAHDIFAERDVATEKKGDK